MADRDARSFALERQAAILRVLDDAGRVISAQVAERLGVSIDTVRRDLAELEVAGALRRVHGGAVPPAREPAPRRYVDRLEQEAPARAVVAGLAQRFVAP